MIVRIDHKINNRKREIIKKALMSAKYFIKSKYPELTFKNLVINFYERYDKRGYKATAIFYNIPGGKKPYIDINIIRRFRLYRLKTCGYQTIQSKSGLKVSLYVNITHSLIHELTHYHQYKTGRSLNEVETTLNEIEYLRLYHPSIFKKLRKIKSKK